MHIVEAQAGIVTYRQALALGYTHDEIHSKLRRGLWQALHRGVYATFSGPPSRRALMWAALLAAGEQAVLSHASAAELAGLLDKPAAVIHVTIPERRRVRTALTGVVVHRSSRLADSRHPVKVPPQTRVEDTVLDLAASSRSVGEAINWLTVACARRRTTPARLLAAMGHRKRVRWRRELAAALADVGSGVHSPLERTYLRDVERAHGLPQGKRQQRQIRIGGNIYDDVNYVDHGVVVELDFFGGPPSGVGVAGSGAGQLGRATQRSGSPLRMG